MNFYSSVKFNSELTSVDASHSDISNSCSLNDVSDDKLLDGLILWNASSAIGAAYSLYMSTVVLAASSITTFLGLKNEKKTNRFRLESEFSFLKLRD
jgi:hypothetical protein